MRRIAIGLLVAPFLVGCGHGDTSAGTYRNATGAEIILNSDGTYRYMLGERTSPRDIQGSYNSAGTRLIFGGSENHFKEGIVSGDRLTVADRFGAQVEFRKQ